MAIPDLCHGLVWPSEIMAGKLMCQQCGVISLPLPTTEIENKTTSRSLMVFSVKPTTQGPCEVVSWHPVRENLL